MSKEQILKVDQMLSPYYRTLVIALLSLLGFFCGKTYSIVLSDHDINIRQSEELKNYAVMPDKVEQLQRDVLTIKTKMNYHVEEN